MIYLLYYLHPFQEVHCETIQYYTALLLEYKIQQMAPTLRIAVYLRLQADSPHICVEEEIAMSSQPMAMPYFL